MSWDHSRAIYQNELLTTQSLERNTTNCVAWTAVTAFIIILSIGIPHSFLPAFDRRFYLLNRQVKLDKEHTWKFSQRLSIIMYLYRDFCLINFGLIFSFLFFLPQKNLMFNLNIKSLKILGNVKKRIWKNCKTR